MNPDPLVLICGCALVFMALVLLAYAIAYARRDRRDRCGHFGIAGPDYISYVALPALLASITGAMVGGLLTLLRGV